MKVSMNLKLAGISVLLLSMLAACDKPGPLETAGKNIDHAVDKAGNKVEDTADKVKDKINEK